MANSHGGGWRGATSPKDGDKWGWWCCLVLPFLWFIQNNNDDCRATTTTGQSIWRARSGGLVAQLWWSLIHTRMKLKEKKNEWNCCFGRLVRLSLEARFGILCRKFAVSHLKWSDQLSVGNRGKNSELLFLLSKIYWNRGRISRRCPS